MNEVKSNEMTKLYVQIEGMRFNHQAEVEDLKLQIDNLKQLVANDREATDLEN